MIPEPIDEGEEEKEEEKQSESNDDSHLLLEAVKNRLAKQSSRPMEDTVPLESAPE